MFYQPTYRVVWPCIRATPRTYLNAGMAHSSGSTRYVEAGAFSFINLPRLVAIIHDFVPVGDCVTGAGGGTYLTVLTKILQTKINWFIGLQWDVSQDHRGFVVQS